ARARRHVGQHAVTTSRRMSVGKVLFTSLLAGALAMQSAGCANPFAAKPANTYGLSGAHSQPSNSLTDNMVTRSFSSMFKKSADALTPKPREMPASDPISLAHESPPPSPELYVSMAEMKEKSGDLASAATHYGNA